MGAEIGKHLIDLERAMREDAWSDALDALRALWASHRSLALRELAELVSQRVELSVPALPAGKRDVMQRQWLATAAKKRPADLPRLIRALSETHFRSTDALVRAKRLRAFGVDPRASSLLVDQLLHPRFVSASSKPFWLEVFALLRLQADPSAIALLREYQRRLPSVLRHSVSRAMLTWFRNQAQAIIDELIRAPPAPFWRHESAVARCLEVARQAEATERKLLEAVYRAPTDDAPRMVYADALMSRGDERGEFISSQIGGRDAAKAQRLLDDNRARWLGPLASVVVLSRFERGFLCAAHVTDDEEALSSVIGDPGWSTVTSLGTREWSAAFERLMTDPVMRSLKTLAAPPEVLTARQPLPVTTLRFDGPFDSSARATRQFVAALAKSRVLKNIRHLTVRPLPGWPQWVARLPWVKQLETLALNIDHSRSLREWAEAAASIRSLRRFRLERDTVELENEIDFELLRPRGSAIWHSLRISSARSWNDVVVAELIAGVPKGLKEIFFDLQSPLSKSQQSRLDGWLEGLGSAAPRLDYGSRGEPQ